MTERETALNASKKQAVLDMLATGTVVSLSLDARCRGVVVPTEYVYQHGLVLQIGMNVLLNIPDLNVDDNGITCTLSFNRRGIWCHIPWAALWAITPSIGPSKLWPESMPPEAINPDALRAAEKAKAVKAHAQAKATSPKKRNSKLPKGWRIIEGGKK